MRILILTSSRADFGIYLPLIKLLKNDSFFDLKILAFGTHLSKFHGYTLKNITDSGIFVDYTISTILTNDEPSDIATSFGLTVLKFADFWKENSKIFDIVFVLGDRFEMAAAVSAGIPFNIRFAHIHGGETTLGAIDNIFRHSITLASKIHFVSLPEYKTKVNELFGSDQNDCHITGALSLDNISQIEMLSIDSFYKVWGINLNIPTILMTIHPETIGHEKNENFAKCIFEVCEILAKDVQLVITMPNADTNGLIFREYYNKLIINPKNKIHLVENFGTQSYFTCMKYSQLVIGNTSSGIIEAASFQKFVINIGNRQKGRLHGDNVIDVPFEKENITRFSSQNMGRIYKKDNIYFLGGAAKKIVEVIKIL